ncbi:tropomyosin alpha-3 chain-like [Latimeria chalumnae]|uniref:tropomyosin alpha-3 chain-like n=1 Tax=Latimeria chalumnae TaxID=7897 RepID=UPI00313CC9ED
METDSGGLPAGQEVLGESSQAKSEQPEPSTSSFQQKDTKARANGSKEQTHSESKGMESEIEKEKEDKTDADAEEEQRKSKEADLTAEEKMDREAEEIAEQNAQKNENTETSILEVKGISENQKERNVSLPKKAEGELQALIGKGEKDPKTVSQEMVNEPEIQIQKLFVWADVIEETPQSGTIATEGGVEMTVENEEPFQTVSKRERKKKRPLEKGGKAGRIEPTEEEITISSRVLRKQQPLGKYSVKSKGKEQDTKEEKEKVQNKGAAIRKAITTKNRFISLNSDLETDSEGLISSSEEMEVFQASTSSKRRHSLDNSERNSQRGKPTIDIK